MFEQGVSSGKAPMIDLSLSSDEENFIADTSHNAEFTKKLFGDHNRDIFGPPGDGKLIILDDSNKEKEVPDENTAGTKLVAIFAVVNPASIASVVADDAPMGVKMIIVMIRGPIRRLAAAMAMEVASVRLRPLCRRPRC
jgi:hypothetical protein